MKKIKKGDFVKFESLIDYGHIVYGVYLGEEPSKKKHDFYGSSRIRFIYITDPNAKAEDYDEEIWHRPPSQLTPCTKEEKVMVSLYKLQGLKKPKEA